MWLNAVDGIIPGGISIDDFVAVTKRSEEHTSELQSH